MSKHDASLILATASGLEEIAAEFPGPHVGSYFNKLVKRALLLSNVPVLLFLNESKVAPKALKGRFSAGECHAVCDPDLPWVEVCRQYPVGFCFGAHTEARLDEITEALPREVEWVRGRVRHDANRWTQIVTNPVFDSTLSQ